METLTRPITQTAAAAVDPAITAHLQNRIDTTFTKRWLEEWGGTSLLHGRSPGIDAVHLDGNDYLGLSGHPHIVDAQLTALRKHNESVIQSGVFLHLTHPQHLFEQRMAGWVGKEDGFLCQSGYAANLGLLQSIADAQTPVYLDTLAHMSLWEGVHAARATGHAFRHNDPQNLDRMLSRHGPGVVVVDSIYSTTGAMCPLREMVEAAERHGSMIVVDESHSLGTHGPGGAGLCAQLGLTQRVHFITASLAKAFAGRAGFFTLPAAMRNYTLTNSFPNMFSSCLLPHEIAGMVATLDVVQQADAQRGRLQMITQRLRATFTALGYPIHQGSEQIIALEPGAEPDTMLLRDQFEAQAVFGAVFCAPATSRNRSMLRLTLSAALTDAEVAHIEHAATVVAPAVKPWNWPIARRAGRPGS